MVSYTTNYNLALYDAVTDSSELFLDYRSDIAGTSSSNSTKLETALTDIQDQIDVLGGGTVFVDAAFSAGSLYIATGISEITAYTTNLQILLRVDQDSDGTVTLNINSLGVKSIYNINDSGTGVNLIGAHLKNNKEYLLRYNGTVWVVVSDVENPAVISKNIETLSATKTLTDYSESMQDLDPNGSNRDVGLPAEDSKNPYFVIYNSGSGGYTLTVKDDSPATIGTVENDEVRIFYSTGVEWISLSDVGFTSPLTTKGDLFGYSTVDARLPVGTDGQVLKSDSGEALGLNWDEPSPLTTKGDLLGYSTVDVRLPVGTDGLVLKADSGETPGLKWDTVAPGKHTVYIPASFMSPATTNPCGDFTQVELTAQQPELRVLPFDGSAKEYAVFELVFPKRWNNGTLTYRSQWTSEATDTGTCIWGLQARASGDGDAINGAFGSAVEVSDAAQSTSRDQYRTAESAVVTIGNTPAEGDMIYFTFYRDGATDTMTQDGEFIGLELFYTTDAENDD